MADLDQLLRGDLASIAADGATVPDFAPLERRGIRRRRTRSVAVTVSTASAVLLVGLAAVQLGGSDRATPPFAPSQTPTPTPAVETLTADQIVDDPAARVAAVMVAPEDPRIRAVVWRLCKNERCSRMHEAVAITEDGFRTRATVIINAFPVYAGQGVFSFGFGNPRLLQPDGTVVEITGLQSDEAPLAPGEVPVSYGSGVLRMVGVDPRTGAGHPVPTPQNFAAVERLAAGTRLASHVFDSTDYVWSDNGGTTWNRTPLATGDNVMTRYAASRDQNPIAVFEGGDGATLFPLSAVHRSLDGGATFERIPLFDDPMAYGQTAGVLPDGRLLLDIEAWSEGEERPVGLHISNGTDWSDLRPVEEAQQYAGDQPEIVATPDGLLVVYREGVASTDAGQMWRAFSLR